MDEETRTLKDNPNAVETKKASISSSRGCWLLLCTFLVAILFLVYFAWEQNPKNTPPILPKPSTSPVFDLTETGTTHSSEYEEAQNKDDDKNNNDDDEEALTSAQITFKQEEAAFEELAQQEDDDDDNDDDLLNEEYENVTLTTENTVAAPRTMPELPYTELDFTRHRYVWFSPTGGMSNQRMGVENALFMAHLLNRTLLLPMIGAHPHHYQRFIELPKHQLFPADRLLDLTIMTKLARVIPLDVSQAEMFALLERIKVPYQSVYVPRQFCGMCEAKRFKDSRARILFFSGSWNWEPWFPGRFQLVAQHHVAYSQYLRALSIRIAQDSMGPIFYSVHGRLGDEKYKWEKWTSQEAFVDKLKFKSWDTKQYPVYLASDDSKDAFFNDLRKAAKVFTLYDLRGLDAFFDLFPNKNVRADMSGVLDKLICAQAKGFIGSPFSTFTWDIERYRLQRKWVFPELIVDRDDEDQ